MTKIRTLTSDQAATEYLVSLCKVAREFRASRMSTYLENPANTDSFWIQDLRERATAVNGRRSSWRKFRIGVALAFFDNEKPWLTNAKLGLADDLVAAQSLIVYYKMQEANCRFLNGAIAKEQTSFFRTSKGRSDYAFWCDDVRMASARCDEVRSELMVAYQETENTISNIRRMIIGQAYSSKSTNILGELGKKPDDSNFLTKCVQLRQIVMPCRRQALDTFQYYLMEAEREVNERIATLLVDLSKLDTEYYKTLHGQESEAQ